MLGGVAIIGEKIAEAWGIVTDIGRLNVNAFFIEHWSKDVIVMNSNITMLMNVFNQLIPAWIATLLFVNLSDYYEIFGLIGFSICISAPFPMVGLGILMLGVFGKLCIKNKFELRKFFSISNLCSLVTLTVGGIYYWGNNSSSVTLRNILAPMGEMNPVMWLLIAFSLTFGGWAIMIFVIKRNYSIIFISFSLILINFISVGGTIDFAMRASIPAYFIIMLYVLECLCEHVTQGIGKKVQSFMPIVLTVSFMTVWLCFMSLLKLAVEAKTLKRPNDTATCYSLEGNADEYDSIFFQQYTKRNPEQDFFFGKLCGIKYECCYPVIEKEVDINTGEVRIKSVTMQLSQSGDFLLLIAKEDREYALEQIESQLITDGGKGKVEFSETLGIAREFLIEDYDLDIEWLDYSKWIDICEGERLAHLRITNNSDKVIAFSELNDEKPGVGICAKLTDSMGNVYFPISLRKINRFLFPGESVSLGMAIPAYIVKQSQDCVLEFGVYQIIENEGGMESRFYATTRGQKYNVVYR